jgi:hypothetical protein
LDCGKWFSASAGLYNSLDQIANRLNFGWHGAFDSRSLTSFSNNFRPLARSPAASGGFFR